MKNVSYRLDHKARLWVRSEGQGWHFASPDESEQIFLSYPEIALQAFWVGLPRRQGAVLPLAA